jgi:hypothetical protein
MRPAAATCLVLAAALSSVAASGDAVPASAAAREPKDGAVALRPVAGAPALVHTADQKPLPSCGEGVYGLGYRVQVLVFGVQAHLPSQQLTRTDSLARRARQCIHGRFYHYLRLHF